MFDSRTDRPTDGQMDGQTDRITIPKTALAYMLRAVKINYKLQYEVFIEYTNTSTVRSSYPVSHEISNSQKRVYGYFEDKILHLH